jgi:hypothetical protein
MIKPKIALAAEYVIFDAETGSTTIVNVLESIKPMVPFPWAFPRMMFWVAMERELNDPGLGTLKFSLSLNEKELSATPVDYRFPENHTVTNLVFNLNGFLVHSGGKVAFRLLNNDGTVFVEYLLSIEAPPPAVKLSQPALLDNPSNVGQVTPSLANQAS